MPTPIGQGSSQDAPDGQLQPTPLDGDRARDNANAATRARRGVAIVALLVTGIFVYGAWGLDVGTSARPGPGLMPRLAAAGLALSAVLALLERVRPSADVEDVPDSPGGRRQALMVGTLTGYIVMLPALGFLVASAFALSICSWIISPTRRVRRAAMIGVAIALAVDLSFRLLLNVNLPSGLWDVRTA